VIRAALCLVILLAGCWHKPVHIKVKSGKVDIHLHRVKTSNAQFYWHKDVENRAKTFQLILNGANLLEGLRTTSSTYRHREFFSFHRDRHICVRTIARAESGKTYADFWCHVSYGHTGDSRPIYQREQLVIVASGGHTIALDEPQSGNLPIAHGQGLPVRHFRFDCTTGQPVKTSFFYDIPEDVKANLSPFIGDTPLSPWWVKDPDLACAALAMAETKHYEPFAQTKYTPTFPGMTGGQQQFGAYLVLPELNSNGYRLGSWRAQLYQEGCRPAHFLHPDGSRVTEDDYPDTVLTSSGWIHERSRGSYWIKHTHPSSHWRDKGARDKSGRAWSYWDAQHWSLNAICQVFQVYGQDPGLRLLIEDLAEGWLWSNPVTNKGTTHHHGPGSARGRGRVLESGCALAQVLDGQIRQRLMNRIEALAVLQLDEFRARIMANMSPIVFKSGEASVWQHGLWVKGLFAASATIDTHKQELHTMAAYLSRWVLDGFKQYGGRWYIPYLINVNGSYSSKPSKQLSWWCLPAIELLNVFELDKLTKIQQTKVKEILAELWADPPINNGYGDQSKWRLFR